MSPADEPTNQHALPWATAFGEPTERVLRADEFEPWEAARRLRCGHPAPLPWCKVCRGTLNVIEAFSQGTDRVTVLPCL